MRVLTSLGQRKRQDAPTIAVSCFNGEVDLGGVVGSEGARDTVAQVAGSVTGVTAVRNGLLVG
ncbi:MAG: BON domain-containing protein [Gammaproteobacteria bacterium]